MFGRSPKPSRHPSSCRATFASLVICRLYSNGSLENGACPDFLFHSIAFAPRDDLHTSLVNCSAEGFAVAMDVSCNSLIRMAKLALPLMTGGGSLQTASFYGADRVVENYNLMGPVKAALESTVRTLAADLADRNIHVHALSSGPVKTRAASGIDRFDELLDRVREHTPANQFVTVDQIGALGTIPCQRGRCAPDRLGHLCRSGLPHHCMSGRRRHKCSRRTGQDRRRRRLELGLISPTANLDACWDYGHLDSSDHREMTANASKR
jgi:NAD(P)-dependent dehydrogenase (short-subunit alcohol dehydrogenase family)